MTNVAPLEDASHSVDSRPSPESPVTAARGSAVVLRPAADDDAEHIARLWHRGWRDGHEGNVPAELHAHRKLGDFRRWVVPKLALTTVAMAGSDLVGFITVLQDKIEQLYLDASARGTGVASTLLDRGEHEIAAEFDTAWLAVVAGNIRARRFYAREGWRNTGAFTYRAHTAEGTFPVPALRYEKQLAVHKTDFE